MSILRTNYYKLIYGIKIGRGTVFQGSAEIVSEGHTEIGDNCVISPWVVLREWGGYIKIGNNCSINSFCHLSGNGGGGNRKFCKNCNTMCNHICKS